METLFLCLIWLILDEEMETMFLCLIYLILDEETETLVNGKTEDTSKENVQFRKSTNLPPPCPPPFMDQAAYWNYEWPLLGPTL